MKQWSAKDPDEVGDFTIDWSGRLSGDLISTSTWTVPAGLTKGSDSHDRTSTTVWLSSGVLGARYQILNRIETLGGRQMDQTVLLKIKSR
jgi:hypothetical protein